MQKAIVIAVASRANQLAVEIEGGRYAILQLFTGVKLRAGDVLSGRFFNVGGVRLQQLDGQSLVCAMLGIRSREAALRLVARR